MLSSPATLPAQRICSLRDMLADRFECSSTEIVPDKYLCQ